MRLPPDACLRKVSLSRTPRRVPHVSHFMQVPLRTSVKFWHSPQAVALIALGLRLGARLGGLRLAIGLGSCPGERSRASAPARASLRLGLERGRAGGVQCRDVVAAATARVGASTPRPAATPLTTASLSVRERVRPFDTKRGRRVRRLAFLLALAERVEAGFARVDMREVEARQVAHGELAEHVVEDRGRELDGVVALHRARTARSA